MTMWRVRVSDDHKQMLGYAFALFFMKGLSLIMLPITTRFLSPTQIGELEILAVTASLIGILLSGSLHEALYRYCAEKQQFTQKQNVASRLFTLTLMISLVFSFMGLVVTSSLNWPQSWVISRDGVMILWVSLTIEGAIAIALAWLRMQEKVTEFCRICIGSSLLQVSLVLCALQFGYGVIGVLIAGFVAHLAQFVLLFICSNLTLRLPSRDFTQKTLHYALPLMLSGLVAFGLNGAERWLMLEGESLAMVGQYAVAAKFALAMCILVQPFGMWWMPRRFEVAINSPLTAAKTTELGFVYICALTITIAVAGQWLLNLVLTDNYAMASHLLVGALFMVLGKELAELINLGLLQQKRTQTILLVNTLTTTLTLLWCSFTYQWGIWSIMLSIGTAQIIRAGLLYHLSQHCHFLPYRSIRLCLYTFITLLGLSATQANSLVQVSFFIQDGIIVLLSISGLGVVYFITVPRAMMSQKAGIE